MADTHAYQGMLGTFDPYVLEITSIFGKQHTDSEMNPDSEESVSAWANMIHEWTHFMQFCSTTYGLVLTLHRMGEQAKLRLLCETIADSMRAHGESPRVSVPILEAHARGSFPVYLRPYLVDFESSWAKFEERLKVVHGALGFTSDGSPIFQPLPREIADRLPYARDFSGEPLTVGHVVEPIAKGCEGQWLFSRLGSEEVSRKLARQLPMHGVYQLLPAAETALGINVPTRMILHDLALMVPVISPAADETPPPRLCSPPWRLLEALKAISSGAVGQPDDSEPESYLRLAAQLSETLGWPDYRALVGEALSVIDTWTPPEMGTSGLLHVLDDFRRAFEVRLHSPDAFVCLTQESLELYNSGWQPAWRLDGVWAVAPGESSERETAPISHDRLLVSLMARAVRALVVGTEWECPNAMTCQAALEGSRLRFSFGPTGHDRCACRFALKLVTGISLDAIEGS